MKQKQRAFLRYRTLILALLLFTLAFSAQPFSAASESDYLTADVTAEYGQTEGRAMLERVNELRTGADAWYWNATDTEKVSCEGLRELTYDYKLEKVAMKRAMELVLSYSHTRPNGARSFTAYDEEGVTSLAAGENIAIGYPTEKTVFEAWAEEDEPYAGQGHRRNMLSNKFTAIGIGHVVYKGIHYWVQEFASSVSSAEVTSAINGESTVSVELLKANIQEKTINCSPDAYSLAPGESKELPAVYAEIRMNDTYEYAPSAEFPLSCTWSVENSDYAAVSGNAVNGIKEGTTYLTASVDLNGTEQIRIPVTVQPIPLSDADVQLETDSCVYDGVEKKPAVQSVTVNGKQLIENQDYTVTYSNNTECGTATVTITGTGNYTGTCKQQFFINPKPIGGVTVEGLADRVYCGEPWIQELQVKDGTILLAENKDYQVTYSDNVNAGTAKIKIEGIGHYAGTLTKSFAIKPKSIAELDIAEIQEQAYTGKEIRPEVIIQDGTRRLTEGVDYTATYRNNIECGKAEVTVAGIGNYTDTQRGTFDIKKAIAEVQIEEIANQTYCGEQIMPELIIKDGETLLVEGVDYQVSYQSNLNAGTAMIQIEGLGSYTGSITKSFVIQRKSIKDAVIDVTGGYSYTGAEIVPTVVVTENGKALQEGRDYTISCRNNLNAGTAGLTIEGAGNYCDQAETAFEIQKTSQTVTAKAFTKTYGDKAFSLGAKAKTKLTYKSSNTKVATVSSAGKVTLKGPGKATITITAAASGNYNGASKNITITVKPKKAVLKTAKSTKKRTLKVIWKQDTKATGYQVVVARDKKFKKGQKTALIKNNKTTSRTFKKLKRRKNYYYKVRAYKQVGNTKLYGAYSKVKRIKVK